MPRLYFRLLHGHSAKMLPPPRPFQSMLVLAQFSSRILAKPMVANREPLSVLNISGMPLSNLFSRATMQNSHSRDVDISWLKTYRLYQVHHDHQVHESGPHSDIRYVARPDLVGSLHIQAAEQVRIFFMFLVGPAQVGLLIDSLDDHFRH